MAGQAEAEKATPGVERAASTLWRVGADGRIASPVVRGAWSNVLSDGDDRRRDGDKDVAAGRRRDDGGGPDASGLWMWIERYGVPKSLYTDKKNVFVLSEKDRENARQEGREALTQFGRACKKLGIEIIRAHSPQAKGRVERSNKVYQSRCIGKGTAA